MIDDSAMDAPSKLDELIAAYLKSVEAGEPLDRDRLLRENPEWAKELKAFFTDQDRFERIAAPLRQVVADETVPFSPQGESEIPELPRVRYFGDYELKEEIARGGMGVVYKARQVSLNRVVALKMILSGKLAGEDELRRFRVEAEAAASLDHPNIVPIYEIGEHDGKQYFSMKLVEGSSLAKKIPQYVKDTHAAAKLMATVARGVHYAHQRGILHRDLKPANILLDANDQPHITDFGLAKRVEGDIGLTQSGAIVGTPAYMSPEQASGEAKRLTTSADVYSLGAIFYELLTGAAPFKADNVLAVLIKVKTEEPTKINAKIDRDLATIALKCLEKDPKNRYGSAEALAEELERWLRGEPIYAREASAVERFGRWCKRNPAVAGLGATVFCVLLIGIAVSSFYAREASQHAKVASENAAKVREQLIKTEAALTEARHQEGLIWLERAKKLAGEKNYFSAALDALRAIGLENGQSAQYNEIETIQRFPPLLKKNSNSYDEAKRYFSNFIGVPIWMSIPYKSGVVTSICFSPDGEILASADEAGLIILWNVASGSLEKVLETNKSPINSIDFSPDCKLLISGSENGILRLWDVENYVEKARIENKSAILSVKFSPDGKKFSTCHRDRTVRIWNTTTAKEEITLESRNQSEGFHNASFSEDGELLCASGDTQFTLLDLFKKEELLVPQKNPYPFKLVASFFENSNRIYSVFENRIVVNYISKKGTYPEELIKLKDSTYAGCIGCSVSPNGTYVALTDNRGWVTMCDDRYDEQSIFSVANTRATTFSPDGSSLAVAHSDSDLNRIWILNVNQERETIRIQDNNLRASCRAISKNELLVATGGYFYVKLWNRVNGCIVDELKIEGSESVCFSQDDQFLEIGTSEGDIICYDIKSKTIKYTLKTKNGKIIRLSFNRFCNKSFAISRKENDSNTNSRPEYQVHVWTNVDGMNLQSLVICELTNSISISPNGELMGLSFSRKILLWNLVTGKTFETDFTSKGYGSELRFSPDGKSLALISGPSGKLVKCIDIFDIADLIKANNSVVKSRTILNNDVPAWINVRDESMGSTFEAKGVAGGIALIDSTAKGYDFNEYLNYFEVTDSGQEPVIRGGGMPYLNVSPNTHVGILRDPKTSREEKNVLLFWCYYRALNKNSARLMLSRLSPGKDRDEAQEAFDKRFGPKSVEK